jgi:hypothetical protein
MTRLSVCLEWVVGDHSPTRSHFRRYFQRFRALPRAARDDYGQPKTTSALQTATSPLAFDLRTWWTTSPLRKVER